MGVRRFRPTARVALFLAAQGRCAQCGAPLQPGWHARSRRPGERRRRDRAGQRPGAVPALQPREGRTARVIAPAALAGRVPRAACGARGAGLPARGDARRGQDARGVPRDPRRAGGADRGRVSDDRAARAVGRRRGRRRAAPGPALAQRGRRLARRRRRRRRDLPAGRVGARTCSPTTSRGPTFVVLDEVHHAGESATWGTALRAAFDGARHRLALSGTPFRSDARAIPFVRYDEERRCAPDFVYGYGDAVRDDVCRPLAFRLLDATLRWRVDAQETIAAFADELDADRRRPPAAHRDRPEHAAAAADAARRRRAADQGTRGDPGRRRARALRRPHPRPRHRRAAAHDRR